MSQQSPESPQDPRLIVATSNPVYVSMVATLENEFAAVTVRSPAELDAALAQFSNVEMVVFPHWSFILPPRIHTAVECVLFHMTDLPYGRGGSPLQNLIVRGHESTMMTALRVQKGLDTGDVYCKRPLSLLGTASEVFLRAEQVMLEMTREILTERPVPVPQTGEVTVFKRRTPQQSAIDGITTLQEFFDRIRMLDAEGYPAAFIETEHFRLEFSRASRKHDSVLADVRIVQK